MYIDVDRRARVHLMEMTFEEAVALREMICGASLEHRRVFEKVRRQIDLSLDRLMKNEKVDGRETLPVDEVMNNEQKKGEKNEN